MEFYGCQKKDTGIDYYNGKSTFPCYFCLWYVTLKVVVLTIMLGHSAVSCGFDHIYWRNP